jgi:hypothetical protein
MFNRLGFIVLCFGLLFGVVAEAASTKRLSDTEKDHFYAVRVFMGEKEQKAWLKLKTQAERDGWLKKQGHWERFYQFDEDVRAKIVAGEVEVGWSLDAVLMAWGMPRQRKRMTGRPATRSEMFVYRFEVDLEGYVTVWRPKSKTAHRAKKLYQIDAVLDDARVSELRRKDKWD